jgi:hypothetical protein
MEKIMAITVMNEPGNNAIRRCWNMEGVVKISSAVQQ